MEHLQPIVLVEVSGGIPYIYSNSPFPIIVFDNDIEIEGETDSEYQAAEDAHRVEKEAFKALASKIGGKSMPQHRATDPRYAQDIKYHEVGEMLASIRVLVLGAMKQKCPDGSTATCNVHSHREMIIHNDGGRLFFGYKSSTVSTTSDSISLEDLMEIAEYMYVEQPA